MTEAWLQFNPPYLAHRGASACAPENTLAAFKAAKKQGLNWVEFDVMLAACGEPLVFHDERLDRTSNGQGFLKDYSYDELKTLDAGSWFHPRFAGERIPRLSEVLAFLEMENLSANIEVKAFGSREREAVAAVLKKLADYPRIPQIFFSSFSTQILKELRLQAPRAHLGLLMDHWKTGWEGLYRDLCCSSLNLNHQLLNPFLVHELKSQNFLLLAYTVNEPARAQELFSWGLDAIFTDCPERMLLHK